MSDRCVSRSADAEPEADVCRRPSGLSLVRSPLWLLPTPPRFHGVCVSPSPGSHVIVHGCSGKHGPRLCHPTEKFEAHSSTVSCLALGKSSGRLLATGGHDCRVNLWAVSKANCIMVRAPGQVTTRSPPDQGRCFDPRVCPAIRVQWSVSSSTCLRTRSSLVPSLDLLESGTWKLPRVSVCVCVCRRPGDVI